ncbi:hypothetical protein GBA52_001908 [Prunus armeniaca]|nr:hypothetical protein GBA52_001908 [Prunus armeniaca]
MSQRFGQLNHKFKIAVRERRTHFSMVDDNMQIQGSTFCILCRKLHASCNKKAGFCNFDQVEGACSRPTTTRTGLNQKITTTSHTWLDFKDLEAWVVVRKDGEESVGDLEEEESRSKTKLEVAVAVAFAVEDTFFDSGYHGEEYDTRNEVQMH